MKVVNFKPRENWQEKMVELGFAFHSGDGGYWLEEEAIEFTEKEYKNIEQATNEVHAMCLELVGDIVKKGDYQHYNLLNIHKEEIERSWKEKDFYLYGRYDLSLTPEGVPKFLEYNADTPTTLLECGLAQLKWQEEMQHGGKFINNIHAALRQRWLLWKDKYGSELLHFTTFQNYEEDWCNLLYVADAAKDVGLNIKLTDIETIQFDNNLQCYLDQDEVPIKHMFKIYPWEWIWENEFSLLMHKSIKLVEPAWKYLLSNKTMWPLIWEKFPNHPNLLASYFNDSEIEKVTSKYVSKPTLSREGHNVTFFKDSEVEIFTGGIYLDSPIIFQERCDAVKLNGSYYNFGSWLIGDVFSGVGVRKENDLIVRNISLYSPSYFK